MGGGGSGEEWKGIGSERMLVQCFIYGDGSGGGIWK